MGNYDKNSDMQTYWNEEGGIKWTENIGVVESMLIPVTGKLVEEISVSEGESVLDVGCGGGITSITLAEQVGSTGRVMGVDVSEPILDIASSRGAGIENLQFQQSDAASASFDGNSFDVITSRFGVMFFDDPVQAFSNLHNALKPCGRLVFLCWRKVVENPFMALPARLAMEIVPPPADAEKPDPTAPGPFSLGDPAHLETILRSAGFNNIELQGVDISLPMSELDEAITFLMKMGPAAEIVKNATEQQRADVESAIKKAMEKYVTADGLDIPSATWIARASK